MSSNGGGSGPPKFVQINGVMKMNPEYKRWKDNLQQQSMPSSLSGDKKTSVPNCAMALPVVTTLADFEALNQAVAISSSSGPNYGRTTTTGEEGEIIVTPSAPPMAAIAWAESTTATMEIFRDPEIANSAGMTAETMFNRLSMLLEKYEVPIGLVNKLLVLSEFQYLEFIMDDSGSMGNITDALDIHGRPQSRWMEAKCRLLEMLEIVAHVPFNRIDICFLNRPSRLQFLRHGRDPTDLYQDMTLQIDNCFAEPPSGTTPFLERLEESFSRGNNQSVARYFFGDGLPNGGDAAQRRITNLLQHRTNPQQNPVSFLSCTNEDAQVEWMKECEEIAPYVSESDDFGDESREVLKDQGDALPYTKGFYLITALVGAMNPHDLDAMDESVPLTKRTLDNLLGICHNDATYRHYFDRFVDAQRRRGIERDEFGRVKESDRIKQSFDWRAQYHDFATTQAAAKDLPTVQQFLAQLKQLDVVWEQSHRSRSRPQQQQPYHHRGGGGGGGASSMNDCCCIS